MLPAAFALQVPLGQLCGHPHQHVRGTAQADQPVAPGTGARLYTVLGPSGEGVDQDPTAAANDGNAAVPCVVAGLFVAVRQHLVQPWHPEQIHRY